MLGAFGASKLACGAVTMYKATLLAHFHSLPLLADRGGGTVPGERGGGARCETERGAQPPLDKLREAGHFLQVLGEI